MVGKLTFTGTVEGESIGFTATGTLNGESAKLTFDGKWSEASPRAEISVWGRYSCTAGIKEGVLIAWRF